ncbi:hypothetical protein KIN20_003269 [Parelaphostrongylus tenuis]|uniref:Aminopeptidase N-like N-terminal domain-containing protein n=1 Tax=Parelaphostrongylus tenuis TaxID=148309 RepID=A0AAD5LZW1_PARTN|nr:hypothetical protein KIN20_003269 [Parelaphostrongylus tenuis]
MPSPLHYSLNVTIKNVTPTVLSGDMRIFIRMNQRGKQVTLNVDNELVSIEHINVVNCDTGKDCSLVSGLTLCVTKTVFDQRNQLLSLILFETVDKGTNLRVDLAKFSSVDNMKITYVQSTPLWDRNAPMMIGTLLTNGAARKMFPVLDNMAYRATVDLCVMFTPTAHVRSNAPIRSVMADNLTCFKRTVPLAVQQIAFVGFENAETLIYNNTTLNGTYIPDIEIVFSINKNFRRDKHEWIYQESCKVIMLMTNWTGFPYPLKELKFISAPIRTPFHSTLGLITLQDRLVEHPSYTLAHVTLIHSVIQQWLPGLVGSAKSDEICFMVGARND